MNGDELAVTALVALPDGSEFIRDSVHGSAEQAESLGEELAQRLVDSGARRILDEASAAYG